VADRHAGDESGQAIVIVALLLAVLLGGAALSIDVGSLHASRDTLQQVAEVAAIRGSEDLPSSPDSAKTDALAVVTQNLAGTRLSHFSVAYDTSYLGNGNQLQVTITATVSNSFAGVIGISTSTVSASAAAKHTLASGGNPYALFAGNTVCSGGVSVDKNNGNINGFVHSNGSVTVSGNNTAIPAVSYQQGCSGPTSSQIGGGTVTTTMFSLPYPQTFGFPTTVQSSCCSQFSICSGHTSAVVTIASASSGVYCATSSITIADGTDTTASGGVTLIAPVINFPNTSGVGHAVTLTPYYPTAGDPTSLLMYVTSAMPVAVQSNKTSLTGTLYLPSSDIEFSKNNDTLTGFLEARDITIDKNSIDVITGKGPSVGGTASSVSPTE
jgi:Flp pilus assembly protein TadG